MSSHNFSIAIVAPGGAVPAAKLEPGLAWLRSQGANPVLGRHVYDQYRHFAGSRQQRLLDLEWALTAPEIDAVWFARGGSGTSQLLDHLPWSRLDHPRPVIGFSDATGLLVALAQHGWESIHGPVLTSLAPTYDPTVSMAPGHAQSYGLDAESLEALKALVFEGRSTALSSRLLCGPSSEIQGPVRGGNLTVLASLCGTPHQLRSDRAIIVLEDIAEAPYRLERSLVQLLHSGALEGAAGVALGEFVGCHPPQTAGFKLEEIFIDHLEPLGIPILHQLPIGHGRRNFAFRHGATATLNSGGLTFV